MNFLLIITCIFGFLQHRTPTEQAKQYAAEAQELYAEAKYGAGIILLEKAQKLDSTNIDYQCEIASGYMSVREYPNAESILKRLQYKREVNDKVYQLLGRLYKLQGQQQKAEDFLTKGLKFFPNSGRLYLEMGALKYSQGKIPEALNLWKKGIAAEPSSPSNYYWLAKHYAETDEPIWAVLYGEMFMLLEQNTYRSIEMSHLLFETYRTAFEITAENPNGAKFISNEYSALLDPLSFPARFQQTMLMARRITEMGSEDYEIFYAIADIRYDFIVYWHDQKLHETYPFTMFQLMNESYQLGFWDAYHAWALLRWNEKEFKDWQKNNKKMYENYNLWMTTYKIDPDGKEFLFEPKSKRPTDN